MVFLRNHGARSLAKFLTALCTLNTLLIFPAYSAELPVSALTFDDGRNLGAQLYVEGAGGSPMPVTWADDEVHIMSVISITSDETPDPLYGTDADQPTLPPPLETQEPAAVYQSPLFDDETHEPVTLEPIVLMEPYPPSDVLGDDGSIVDPSPTPCSAKIRAPAPAPLPTPCSSEPTVPAPAIPASGTGITEIPDTTVETPDSTNLTPTSDTDGSEVVVVYTPAADSPNSGSEEPIDVVTDLSGPWEEPAEETQDPLVPTPTSNDTLSTESPEPVMTVITLPGDDDISATAEIPDSTDMTIIPDSDGSDPAVVVVYTPATDSPDSGSEESATDSPAPTPEKLIDVMTRTPEPADALDDTTTPVASPAPIDDTPAPGSVIIIGEATPAPALTPVPGSDVNPRMFATKTAYWDQRDLFIDNPSVQFQRQRTEQELQDLTLLQVQQVNRHGTKFPAKSSIEEILSLIEKLQIKFSDSIPDWLRNYTLPYDVSIEGTLASPGATEMLWLGARTRMAIGSAVPIKYAKEQFVFQHTYESRTKDSARSFASAFFINPQDVQYIEYTKEKDRFLRYFDECPRYLNEVKDNATMNPELSAYKESAQMVEHIEFLKTRLNLPVDADLTVLDLESAYTACAFDIALYNTYSNWCTLLNKQFVGSLEYAEDLESFYEQGAGYKINYEIASVLLKDVYAFIKDLIAGKTQVVGNFRFAHAETTLPLMTLLGYGDRTPLLASYTADQVAQRGFRTSVLAPLAANIDFRLYQSKADAAKYFVQVLVNEKIAPVPGCGGKVFCELSKVEELWGYYLNEYDFDEDCKSPVLSEYASSAGFALGRSDRLMSLASTAMESPYSRIHRLQRAPPAPRTSDPRTTTTTMLVRFLTAALIGATVLNVSLCADAQQQQQQQQQGQGRPVNPRSFATKTAYWDQRSVDDYNVEVLRSKLQAQEELKNLNLVQVQQVNRHGTRFPTKGNTEEIIALLQKLQSNYSSSIPTWLQNYTLPYNVSVEGTLAPAGAVELVKFGARTRETVRAALPTAFAKEKFIFQHTYKSRTKDSATSFAKAFFTNPQDVQYIEYTKNKDRFLRYFDECARYNSEVKENATAAAELEAYKTSKHMDVNIALFKSKLGLPADANITELDIESAYSACAFDIALYNTYSNWCTLLNKQFVGSLEYAEDLESFYEQGAGYKINYEIASVLLKDVYAFIKDLIAGKTQVVGNFRFAHAETTLPLMTLLGYGDRTPLLASYTADQVAQRGFRTSVLAPLAANIDFRLYQSKADAAKYFVQVLVNEKIAPVPGCGGKVFCELSKVEELWGYYLNEYDFDEDCKVK